MRLLLVEDEEKTSSYINRALSELGFTVDVAATGIDGLYLALEYDYDTIVLDVMLPAWMVTAFSKAYAPANKLRF